MELLEENNRRADIDVPLIPLMRQVWRCGMDTLGSCHDIGEGKAYIQFLSSYHGGSTFSDVLQHMHIRHSIVPDPARLDLNLGSNFGDITFYSVKVIFPRDRINDIATTIQKHLNKQQAPPDQH
jgi:hypothetical protein